jgi:hypothetical protein
VYLVSIIVSIIVIHNAHEVGEKAPVCVCVCVCRYVGMCVWI